MSETNFGSDNPAQPAEEQLADTVLAHINQADAEPIPPDSDVESATEPVIAGSGEEVINGPWSEQHDRPDKQTAETMAHATNKLETYLKNAEGHEPADQIEFVKANLQRQIDFIEADPERAEMMYVQTKAELFDRLHSKISTTLEDYGFNGDLYNVGEPGKDIPQFELKNILRDLDQTNVDIAFGGAISRAAAAEQQPPESAVA